MGVGMYICSVRGSKGAGGKGVMLKGEKKKGKRGRKGGLGDGMDGFLWVMEKGEGRNEWGAGV